MFSVFTLLQQAVIYASPGWAIRFCKRHPELLQQSPVLDTALPTPLLRKVETFRSEVQRTVRDGKLALSHVGNMDELYLNFSALVSGSTTNSKRQLLVRRSEMENCHATIVLACLADGNILPPAVITKLGGVEEEAQLADNSVVVLQQEEGLMDSACMCQWLQYVWFKHVPEPNLLLLDCHQPHTGDTVGAEFSSHQSTRLIIPGGCTSKLQPLEVSLKSMFHTSIQKQWSLFNSRSTGAWDGTANKLQLPGRKEIVDWVTVAYQHLQTAEQNWVVFASSDCIPHRKSNQKVRRPSVFEDSSQAETSQQVLFVFIYRQETVRRSFLVTGLTVATNKSEDHFIENLSMIPSHKSRTLKLRFVYDDHRRAHIIGDCRLELLAVKMNAHGFFTAMIANVDRWTRRRSLEIASEANSGRTSPH
ncbi:hypothetical protein ANN_07930 [Periplaneta americana]|uniref:DDE-1 domain-containing protein n=1 Tax=Periplaneta americana TaxID=6978 RepID=A0ABQ8T1K6_PERAM|nr:hypothetical protein ANN_07930 [Periplaneta americana]